MMDFSILVIEDEPDWREALCCMYEDTLKSLSPRVISASTGQEALRIIRKNKFDLISLDINLGRDHPKTPEGTLDRTIIGSDGRTVLEKAYDWDACKGTIVITGAPHDQKLTLVVPDQDELISIKIALPEYIERLFPSRNLIFFKAPNVSVEENIKHYQKYLTAKRISAICQPNYSRYTIELLAGKTEKNPKIVISYPKGKPELIVHAGDAVFLSLLCESKSYPEPYIKKETVVSIYRKIRPETLSKEDLSRFAEIDVNSLRRRLKRKSLDDKRIIIPERRIGWKLHPDVIVRGFASIDKRSSGLGKKYNREMSIDDLTIADKYAYYNRSDEDQD